MGKRFPLKAIRTLGEKTGEAEAEKNDCPQIEPTWEHEALSGTDSILCARFNVHPMGSPRKGGVSTRGETLERELLNLERSDFVFDRQPDAFRSGRAHQWFNGDLTGEKFSAHNY